MRMATRGAVGLSVALILGFAVSQDPSQPDDYWMKKKLEFSQAVLHGITLGDFDQVRKAATSMRRLSNIESFARRSDTKAYRAQLAVFDRANDELIAQSQAKDIDKATEAFTQLTVSCVQCHKHLRDSSP